MEIRQARQDELPLLKDKLAESKGEQIDLSRARVWVAVEGGEIIGMLPLRMCWQAEPLLLWGGNRVTKSRAGLLIYRAMEQWLRGPENVTGIRWLFAVTRKRATAKWLPKLGWHRQYKGAQTFLKYVGD